MTDGIETQTLLLLPWEARNFWGCFPLESESSSSFMRCAGEVFLSRQQRSLFRNPKGSEKRAHPHLMATIYGEKGEGKEFFFPASAVQLSASRLPPSFFRPLFGSVQTAQKQKIGERVKAVVSAGSQKTLPQKAAFESESHYSHTNKRGQRLQGRSSKKEKELQGMVLLPHARKEKKAEFF